MYDPFPPKLIRRFVAWVPKPCGEIHRILLVEESFHVTVIVILKRGLLVCLCFCLCPCLGFCLFKSRGPYFCVAWVVEGLADPGLLDCIRLESGYFGGY